VKKPRRVAKPLGLNFRVAAPPRFFERAEGLGPPLLALHSVDRAKYEGVTQTSHELGRLVGGTLVS
jgi:hypothetical protein